MLDTVVAPAVKEAPRTAPPSSPVIGDCYIVASSPTGAWAGKQQCVAAYSGGRWRFVVPTEGMHVYVQSSDLWAVYRLGAWELGLVRGSSVMLGGQQVISSRRAPISSPSGGASVDAQARTAIDQILGAMRQHGLIET